MIKLVIFDAGDILYDWKSNNDYDKLLTSFLVKHNAKGIGKNREYWSDDNIGKAASIGKISLLEAQMRHLAKHGVSEEFLDEYRKVDEEAHKTLKVKDSQTKDVILQLKKLGYKVAVLSDTPRSKEYKKEILRTVGLDGLFDEIFVSSELRHVKPDKETYVTVLNHFGVKPEDAVFVGHDEDELTGARNVGIHTVSYQGDDAADFSIQNFSELVDIVKKIR